LSSLGRWPRPPAATAHACRLGASGAALDKDARLPPGAAGLAAIDELEREHLGGADGVDATGVGQPLDHGPEPIHV
jgi:hypothetical protein